MFGDSILIVAKVRLRQTNYADLASAGLASSSKSNHKAEFEDPFMVGQAAQHGASSPGQQLARQLSMVRAVLAFEIESQGRVRRSIHSWPSSSAWCEQSWPTVGQAAQHGASSPGHNLPGKCHAISRGYHALPSLATIYCPGSIKQQTLSCSPEPTQAASGNGCYRAVLSFVIVGSGSKFSGLEPQL